MKPTRRTILIFVAVLLLVLTTVAAYTTAAPPMDATRVILLILILIAFTAYLTAMAAYHILSPWVDSQVGRWYMAQLAVFTGSTFLLLINRILNLPSQTLVFVIYTFYAIVGIGTATTIITTQIARRHAEADTAAMDVIEPENLDAPNAQPEARPQTAPEPPEGNASP